MLHLAHRGVAPATLDDVQPVDDAPTSCSGSRDSSTRRRSRDAVIDYVVALVRRTRELPSVALGASPRAAVHLLAAAKAAARLAGRDFVIPDDVVAVAPAVLRHRISCGPKPSSSATAPTTRSRPRSRRYPCPDEPDATRAAYALLAVALRRAGRSRRRVGRARVRWSSVAHRRRRRRRAPSSSACAARCRARCSRVASRRRCVVEADADRAARVEVRQAQPPDVAIEPSVGRGRLDARSRRAPARATRRSRRHRAPRRAARPRALHVRRRGRRRTCSCIPTSPPRSALVVALRRGQFRDPGLRTRGPLGLGTDFESIRDYLPDDDVRQINWTASARVGRPMSNVYRIEQDRDVVCLLDAGRLMSAPLDATHDDPARCRGRRGHDGRARRRRARRPLRRHRVRRRDPTARCAPRRNGGRAVVRAILDLEPTRGRQRLRPRVPLGRRREARAGPRVHRSRRRGGRAVARRRGAGA